MPLQLMLDDVFEKLLAARRASEKRARKDFLELQKNGSPLLVFSIGGEGRTSWSSGDTSVDLIGSPIAFHHGAGKRNLTALRCLRNSASGRLSSLLRQTLGETPYVVYALGCESK